MFGRKALQRRIDELEKAGEKVAEAAYDARPAGRTCQRPDGKWLAQRKQPVSRWSPAGWSTLTAARALDGSWPSLLFTTEEEAAAALERWLSPPTVEYDAGPFRKRDEVSA